MTRNYYIRNLGSRIPPFEEQEDWEQALSARQDGSLWTCFESSEEKDVDKYEKRRNAFIPKIRTDEYSLDEYKDVHDLKGE